MARTPARLKKGIETAISLSAKRYFQGFVPHFRSQQLKHLPPDNMLPLGYDGGHVSLGLQRAERYFPFVMGSQLQWQEQSRYKRQTAD
jgi:hypothetical protein